MSIDRLHAGVNLEIDIIGVVHIRVDMLLQTANALPETKGRFRSLSGMRCRILDREAAHSFVKS